MTSYFKFITRDVKFRLGQSHAGLVFTSGVPPYGAQIVVHRGARPDLGGFGGPGARGPGGGINLGQCEGQGHPQPTPRLDKIMYSRNIRADKRLLQRH
jgi:hypothetical protein